MFKNYIKTAYRSLTKNRAFTAINIFGLALGLTACLLIVLYVIDELSFDRYNIKADRIYRVNEDLKLGNNKVQYAVAMPPLAQTLKTDYPEVENTVRIKNAFSARVKKGNENLTETHVAFADPSLFDVFTLPMISGDKATALKEPNSIVLTETDAKKYFNTTNVVGRELIINDKGGFKVTGVIKDMPNTSHFKFDMFISMSSYPDSRDTHWLRSDYNTYVLLKKGANPKKLEASFPQFLRKYSGSEMQNDLKQSYDDFEKGGSYFRMNLIKLTDIHLHSSMSGELGNNSTPQYLYIFSAIALFILVIACVNFMNLSTARSANRAREVGVRKVLGSSRGYLVAQFLAESILITFIATVIALLAAILLIPAFNHLAGKEIVINAHTFMWLLPVTIVIVAVIGSIAGSYPAFYLSAFQPVDVLKGKLAGGFRASWLRSFLVVLQFSISIFLIIGTLVVYGQLKYIETKDLGYNRDHVLVINNVFDLDKQAPVFKNEIKQLSGVTDATLSGFLPAGGGRGTSIFYKEGQTTDQANAIFPQVWPVDENYVNTLGMKLSAGRNFSKQMGADSTALIINETAARFLGYKDPVGRTLYESADGNHGKMKAYTIVGVVRDFNFDSFKQSVTPLILRMQPDYGSLNIRVSTSNLPALINQIKSKWAALSPNQFSYYFLDDAFQHTFEAEQKFGSIFFLFATLAIIIACLGLFGLAAYAAEQRTKEIGIRKVLGASVAAIVASLSKDFLKLVLISIVIASPIAWLVMHKWLQDFAYRVTMHWYILPVAAVTAMIIAIVTISFQSIKAALMNPVKSLKNE